MHTIFLPELTPDVQELVVEGDEASHASRVKRLGAGDAVRAVNGRGLIAIAEVIEARRTLRLRVRERREESPVRPAVHVLSATPKGPRIAELVEGLVQVGAASWTPIQTKLGVVDPRDSKLERMERIVIEATKQSARAWLMQLREKRTLHAALGEAPRGESLVLASADGEDYRATGAAAVRILVGPEGGFTDEEVASARSAGARIVRFGPHIMRIETAAVIAAAVVLNAEHLLKG